MSNFFILGTILTMLFGSSNLKNNNTCRNFHSGKFTYKYNRHDSTMFFIRENGFQISYHYDSTKYDSARIEWLTDCQYQLIKLNSNLENRGLFKTGDTIIVNMNILDSCKYEYSSTHKGKEFGKGIIEKKE